MAVEGWQCGNADSVAGEAIVNNHKGNIRISQANCRKLFIPRDYSEGSGVRFQSRYLAELEGKIDRQMFDYTVKTLNSLYAEAETANCSTYCEGCMACLTAYVIYFCTETHYEKCLKKVSRFVHEQNEQVWTKRGLLLTDPVERGLRVIEISILTEPLPVGAELQKSV